MVNEGEKQIIIKSNPGSKDLRLLSAVTVDQDVRSGASECSLLMTLQGNQRNELMG